MKASRFSDAQKAFILKQAADGLLPTEMRRLFTQLPVRFLFSSPWCGGRTRNAAVAFQHQQGHAEGSPVQAVDGYGLHLLVQSGDRKL